jgi:hypothetical protein
MNPSWTPPSPPRCGLSKHPGFGATTRQTAIQKPRADIVALRSLTNKEYDENNFILRNFSFVIPNKLAGCHRPGLKPSSLLNDLNILRGLGITSILSLSDVVLDTKQIQAQGLRHLALSVPDYDSPTISQFNDAISFIDEDTGACVVHCNAGMGRTGSFVLFSRRYSIIFRHGACSLFDCPRQKRRSIHRNN